MSGSQATLHHFGHLINVEPSCPELDARLRTYGLTLRRDDEHGVRPQLESKPLSVTPADQFGATYPAGLEPVIRQVLQESGRCIVVESHYGPVPLPKPVPTAHQGLDAANRLVQSQPRGLIRVRCESLVPRVIASIAAGLPTARIAVVGTSRKQLRRVGEEVGRYVPVTLVDGNRPIDGAGRVVVGTVTDMANLGVEIWNRDVVLLLDAMQVLHRRIAGLLMCPDQRFRLFGFLGFDGQLSGSERDWLRAWYGPAEVMLFSKDTIARPVSVTWYKTQRGKVRRVDPRLDARTAKQQGIVANDARNTLVAQRAEALSRADWTRLHLQTAFRLFPSGRRPKTAVLVEDPLHACRLAELLPDWKVAPLPTRGEWQEMLDELPVERERLLEDGDHNADRCVLSAATCTAERLAGLDVLVRADGGAGIPNCLRGSITQNRNCGPLLIVDFRDEHHPVLQRWTAARKQKYLARRWWPLDTREAAS